MAAKWTDEQSEVIRHKTGNLLVAAAAGSGKTAVLSERILELLKDEKAGFEVDRLLVVTFTRAAAAEMKERIGRKISDYVNENPYDTHMRRQATLINNATVTTIDSFCNSIVREFFHVIDLDPSFRIADKSEMLEMQGDVLKNLLEEKYGEADPRFIAFSECYGSSGKKDSNLEPLILSLFEASQSNPYPRYWLETSLEKNRVESLEELDNAEFAKDIVHKVHMLAKGMLDSIDKAIETANEPDGPAKALDLFEIEKRVYKQLLSEETYTGMQKIFEGMSFGTYRGKTKGVDEELSNTAKKYRDAAKKAFLDAEKHMFPLSLDKIVEYGAKTTEHLKVLTELTVEFMERLTAAKKEAGVYTFSDIEHMALYILVSDDPLNITPTIAAKSLSERFDYIVVDEYQDSNLLQENILNAISRKNRITPEHPLGEPNIFMVGDVKQSIYRFREAKPELFMEKYDTYENEGLYRKIILKKNFRSRQQVLDGSNVIFEWCMHKFFGGIEYDREAALYTGNMDYTDVENEMFNLELILVKMDQQDNAENDVFYQEAYSTAEYIKKIMSPGSGFKVMHDGKLEKPRYSDIAILLRSTSNIIDKYTTILSDEGIPVNANVGQGFFGTGEVKTIINFLKCLINPRQDIPFTALLLSPLVGATNEELGRLVTKNGFLYDDICDAEKNGLKVPAHIAGFIEKYRRLKARAGLLPVTELIDEIYDVTGFYRLMLGFPKGARRAANLDFFREQAVTFEKTGNSGLYNFVGYLENCEDKEVDFGEASDENTGDSVSIMTIHHSKGLEYPVIIIPQMFKKRNDSDIKNKLVIHPAFGAALPYVDYERRTKDANLSRNYLADLLKTETVAEELRVLYVAVTRAREKLVLLGAVNDIAKALPDASETDVMSYSELLSSKNFFDFVKGAIFTENAQTERFRDFAAELNEAYKNPAEGAFHTFTPYSETVTLRSKTTGNIVKWDVSIVPGHGKPINALIKSGKTEEALAFAKEVLSGRAGAELAGEERTINLRKAAGFVYPFGELTVKAVKRSVSELKYEQLQSKELDAEDDYDRGVNAAWLADGDSDDDNGNTKQVKANAVKPARKHSKKTGGADAEKTPDPARRGTATHRIMELLPFEKPMSLEDIRHFLDETVKKGLIGEEDAALVDLSKIEAFVASPLYPRMCAAKAKHRLFREQAFTTGEQAEGGDEDDLYLTQGVIDAYFEEEDGAVLLDYKTDKAAPEELKKRYSRQLELYSEAIERVRKLKVKERLIYSFFNDALLSL